MPKSKRAKVITLSKTQSKTRTSKGTLITKLQEYVESYSTIYIFQVANMRTKLFQQLRSDLQPDTRFYMGKRSLIRLAFGKTQKESYVQGLYKLIEVLETLSGEAEAIEGELGLVFTNEKAAVIEEKLNEIQEDEFARGGFIANREIVKEKGELEGYPTSMYEHLRKLKIPVEINKGKLELKDDFRICKENEKLTVEQAESLKIFGIKLAKFRIGLLYKFNKATKKVVKINQLETASLVSKKLQEPGATIEEEDDDEY